MNRVAVTGLGLVCALGNTVAECWAPAKKGESRIRPLADPGKPPYKFGCGAQALDFRPEDHFNDKDILFLERFALLAAVAAVMCSMGLFENAKASAAELSSIAAIACESVMGFLSSTLYRSNGEQISAFSRKKSREPGRRGQLSTPEIPRSLGGKSRR